MERIVRACEPAPLPAGPPELAGLLNFHGKAVPLVDIRRFFGLPGKELVPSDYFILLRSPKGGCAITADSAPELAVCAPEDVLPAAEIFQGPSCVENVIRTAGGLIPVCDAAQLPAGGPAAPAAAGGEGA